MQRKATEVFQDLLEEAIDCTTLKDFEYYSNMTTAHALRCIISLLREKTLYRYNDRLIIKKFGQLCFIHLRKITLLGIELDTIKVDAQFSITHLCKSLRPKDIKRIEDGTLLNQVVYHLTK